MRGGEWLKNSFSIWRNFKRDADSKKHPAAFPTALISQILDCFATDKEGIVLDPFAGSGSTLIAALKNGMSAEGFDINKEYKKLFLKRLDQLGHPAKPWNYRIRDARNLQKYLSANSIEICITSPPYWNILHQKRSADNKLARTYSSKKSDLGNLDNYQDFLFSLTQIANNVHYVLRNRGYFILNVMDLRKGANFYPLHSDIIQEFSKETQLKLEDIIIWDRQSDYNSMRPLGYPYKFIVNKVHEYLLIFRKED